MPIIKSAKKALRQSKRRKTSNLKKASEMKLAVRQLKQAKQKGEVKDSSKMLAQAYQAIDKAAKKGVIKKGAADRKKSRLAKMLSR